MEVAVLSNNKRSLEEIGVVIKMFKSGLQRFHLRKPRFSTKEMKEYIEAIPRKYRKRVILHSHHELAIKFDLGGIHLSRKHRKKNLKNRLRLFWLRTRKPDMILTRTCHSLSDLLSESGKFDYVFLSPVFEGISTKSHSGGYSERSIRSVLERTDHLVFALGGVKPENINKVKDLGFFGCVLSGAVWNLERDKVQTVKDALEAAKKDEPVSSDGEQAPSYQSQSQG